MTTSAQLKHTCTDEGFEDGTCECCNRGLGPEDLDALALTDAQALAEQGLHTQLWKGWRIAYRARCPENESAEACASRVLNKRKASNDRPLVLNARMSKTDEERRAASAAKARQGAQRAKSQRDAGIPAW